MNTLFIPVFLFSFIASTVFAQFTINTPANVVQCEPVMLTWTGGTPQYFLSVLPAGQPSANPLVSFPPMNGTSYSWNVNVSQGTGIFFNLRDSQGVLAQSAPVTILSSSDKSCINASAVVPISSIASSAVGTTTSGSGSTAATGTGTTGGSTAKGSSSSTSTGATTSPSRAAAVSHYAPFGTLAMTGAALAIALVL